MLNPLFKNGRFIGKALAACYALVFLLHIAAMGWNCKLVKELHSQNGWVGNVAESGADSGERAGSPDLAAIDQVEPLNGGASHQHYSSDNPCAFCFSRNKIANGPLKLVVSVALPAAEYGFVPAESYHYPSPYLKSLSARAPPA